MVQRGQKPQQFRQQLPQVMYQNVQVVQQQQAQVGGGIMSATHPQNPRMIIGQQEQVMDMQRPQMV